MQGDHAHPLLEIDGVTKSYELQGQDQNAQEIVAVKEITESVDEGSFVSIVGPSGCGKSTALHMVAGLVTPSSGEIRLRGQRITGPDPRIGMVFQEDSTYPWRTVLGNVEFGLEIAGVPVVERRDRCRQVIELVGLSGFENALPRQLSGGMRQRVAIARSLASDPDILLMDEPFGALDQQTRTFLGQELLQLWSKTRKTILFVTHDIQEAVLLSTEVWVMSFRPGRIIAKIPIDLPETRNSKTMADPQFMRLTSEIWSYIEREWEMNYFRAGGGPSPAAAADRGAYQ